MPVITPTFSCFDDALELLDRRVKHEPWLVHLETLILVHGIALAPEGPQAGTPFAHGWCEERAGDGWTVWASGILEGSRVWYAAGRDEFYAALRVQRTTRYTVRRALEENRRTGHYGPWEPDYLALCSDDHTTFEPGRPITEEQ